jgi:hypothetical protein
MNAPAFAAGFVQFLAFSQDAADNRAFLAQGKIQIRSWPWAGKLHRPYDVADNVENVIIPDCRHWITEECRDDKTCRRFPASPS